MQWFPCGEEIDVQKGMIVIYLLTELITYILGGKSIYVCRDSRNYIGRRGKAQPYFSIFFTTILIYFPLEICSCLMTSLTSRELGTRQTCMVEINCNDDVSTQSDDLACLIVVMKTPTKSTQKPNVKCQTISIHMSNWCLILYGRFVLAKGCWNR